MEKRWSGIFRFRAPKAVPIYFHWDSKCPTRFTGCFDQVVPMALRKNNPLRARQVRRDLVLLGANDRAEM